MLSLFDDDEGWSHVENPPGRSNGVAFFGQLRGLRVVYDQAVNDPKQLPQILMSDIDPKIHRVRNGEYATGQLLKHAELYGRMRVAEKHVATVGEVIGDGWRMLFQDAEFGKERLTIIHVLEVSTTPFEGRRAGADLQSREIDARERVEHRPVLLRPVIANDTNQPGRRVVRCRRSKIGTGSTKHPLGRAGRCVDGIDADGSGDNQGHIKTPSNSTLW